MRPLSAIIAISVCAVIACSHSVLTPPSGPGTVYPCGLQGISCGNGMCCWLGDVCGGGPFNGCPAGYCCYVGPDDANFRYPQTRYEDGR